MVNNYVDVARFFDCMQFSRPSLNLPHVVVQKAVYTFYDKFVRLSHACIVWLGTSVESIRIIFVPNFDAVTLI